MKRMLFVCSLLWSSAPAFAQTSPFPVCTPEELQQQANAFRAGSTAKTTAGYRLIATALRNAADLVNDTAHFDYGGGRGIAPAGNNDFDKKITMVPYGLTLVYDMRAEQTFNADEKLETTQFYGYKDGIWLDNGLVTTEYNTDGQISRVEGTILIGTDRIPYYCMEYTYNPAKLVETIIYKNWNLTAGKWVYKDKLIYAYNSKGKNTSMISQIVSGSSWTDYQKTTFTYDATDTLCRTKSIYANKYSGWDETDRQSYTYDSHNYLVAALQQSVSPGEVLFDKNKTLYTNTASGLKATELTLAYMFSTASWDSVYRSSFTYNTADLMTDAVSQEYDGIAGGFTKAWHKRYYYDPATTDIKTVAATAGTLSLYPVPAQDALHIRLQWAQPQASKARICDLQGRVLRAWDIPVSTSGESVAMIADLPSGTYTISFEGAAKEHITRAFTIAR